MTFPGDVGKLTFSGIHGSGETWAFGFHCSPVPVGTIDLDEVWDAAATMISTSSSGVSSACSMTMVKYALLTNTGHYTETSPAIKESAQGPSGGGAAQYIPQATVVVSLGTAQKRGLAHQGRYYLPPTSMRAENSGYVTESAMDFLLAQQVLFINSVKTAIAGDVVVASDRGAGAVHPVTHLKVGRVIDTQRRRRASLDEQYLERNL